MKSVKKILCLVLAAALLLSVTACGAGQKIPAGYYVLTEKQDNGAGVPFLLFREDGTVTCFNGTEILKASWKNGKLKLAGGSMPCTAEGDVLTLEAGDGTLHFEKSEEKAPDLTELERELRLRSMAGAYLLSDGSLDSVTEQAPFLLLRENRTAVYFDGTRLKEGSWEENQLILTGEDPMDWAAEDASLILRTGKEKLCFRKTDDVPDPEHVRSQLQMLREAGCYLLDEEDCVSEIEQAPFLLLQEDGNAAYFDGESLRKGTWEPGQLNLDKDAPMAYAVKDGDLTLSTAEGKLHFLESGEKAPDLEKVEEALKVPREPGYYELKEIFIDEETVSQEALGQELYLALYEDGTGAICLAGSDYAELNWKDGVLLDSETSEEIAAYTVEKGGLSISGEGINLTFVRSSKNPPDKKTLEELAEPAELGYFVVKQIEMGEITLTEEQLQEMYQLLPFLLFSEDGTAAYYDGEKLRYFTWEEGWLSLPETAEEVLSYEIDGDTVYLKEEDAELILERSSQNLPDLDRLAAGRPDLTGEYALYCYNLGDGTSFDMDMTLSLQEDGSGVCSCNGQTQNFTWDGNSLTISGITYSCKRQENGSLFLEDGEESYIFRPISHGAQNADFWNNDWYGWWLITDCTGDMEDRDGSWWDMCGRSTVDANGTGRFILWDEDYNSIQEPLAEVEFLVEDATETFSGKIYSTSGRMMEQELGTRDWVCNPDESPCENMVTFTGKYATETGSCVYKIFLRPWGTRWDDADDFYIPYYYEDWYLPLINTGKPMPETMDIK